MVENDVDGDELPFLFILGVVYCCCVILLENDDVDCVRNDDDDPKDDPPCRNLVGELQLVQIEVMIAAMEGS